MQSELFHFPVTTVWHVFTDGAGPRKYNDQVNLGLGFAVICDSELIHDYSNVIQNPDGTNILAEFLAIYAALEYAAHHAPAGAGIAIWCDCEYVVDSLKGFVPVRKDHLVGVYGLIKDAMLELGGRVVFNFVPREENTIADMLSKQGFPVKEKKKKGQETIS